MSKTPRTYKLAEKFLRETDGIKDVDVPTVRLLAGHCAQWATLAHQLETELAAMRERAENAEAQLVAFREDAERWAEVEHRMVHQHSGPNVGWTLDGLLPGDSPTEAIDAARRTK